MCIKTKKLLFMTSFGAQALAYLCASNISTVILSSLKKAYQYHKWKWRRL